jgi:hypothetical protein
LPLCKSIKADESARVRDMKGGFKKERLIDREVAIVKGYPIEGGFAIAFFLCIFA